MIISRVLPTLIRFNHAVELRTFTKPQFSHSTRQLLKVPCLDRLEKIQSRKMSTIDDKMGDPKRHFTYEQLNERRKQGAVVVDVREDSEIQQTGQIPGSIHIPLAEVEYALGKMSPEEFAKKYNAEKPSRDREIIFSCKAGSRSVRALKMGLRLGYSKSGNYKGGWLDWAKHNAQN